MKKTRKRRQKSLKLNILGKSCDKQKAWILKYAPLMLAELMSTRMINTLVLRIEVRKTTLDKNYLGVASSRANGSEATKEHKVVLRYTDDKKEFLEVLAHELVHVEQKATNRLQKRYWKSDRQLHARWEGKELGPVHLIPYMERPWEVEAFANEKKIARKVK